MKSIDKSYIIEVANRQTIDGETDVVTEIAEGSFKIRADKRYIMYHGKNDSGEYSAIVIFDGETVNVKRKGFTELNVCCDARTETKTCLVTPFGKIPMTVSTDRIFSDFDEKGGVLELDYTSTVQGDKYINRITIKVKKKREVL